MILHNQFSFRKEGRLDTGHGANNALWVRFGKVKDALIEIKEWLEVHTTEIVVIYFGNRLGNVTEGNKDLRVMLESEFNGHNGSIDLNDFWQKNQEWPTLAMAKETNQRVFAIVRTKTKEEAEIFFGSKVLPEKEYKVDEPVLDLGLGKFIKVLTGYQAVSIGENCSNVVKSMGEACNVHPEAEFVKLPVFGTHSGMKNSPLKCLSKLARQCNPQIKNAIDSCRDNGRNIINFLQADYPNYPSSGHKTIVEIAHEENINNLKLLGHK